TKTSFKIVARSGANVIWSESYSSRNIALKSVSLNIYNITELQIHTDKLRLTKFCYWMCEIEGEFPWESINNKCGLPLPVDIKKSTDYVTEKYGKIPDKDWASALCRLESGGNSDYSYKDFTGIKEILINLKDEKPRCPVGWKLVDYPLEENQCDDTTDQAPEIDIPAYDLLLMQSLDVDVAKILGLYWVDRHIDEDKYYDYKIVGDWTNSQERLLWRLEHEVIFDKPIHSLFAMNMFYQDLFLFRCHSPKLIDVEPNFARVTKGLTFFNNSPADIEIFFGEAIKEIQLFIKHDGPEALLNAYEPGNPQPIDTCRLTDKEGVLAVHGEDMHRLVLRGRNIIIYRIHYDFEYLIPEKLEFAVCGIKITRPKGLKPPTGLKSYCLRGGLTTKDETCHEVRFRFRAGLRWNLPVIANNVLNPYGPISYYVQRITPDGEVVSLNNDSPIQVNLGDDDQQELIEKAGIVLCNNKVLRERIFYQDFIEKKGIYGHKIAALDAFGRKSPFSRIAQMELKLPPPPPPEKVGAKYLDFSTYNAATDEFSDPNLTEADISLLKNHQASGIVVRWIWTDELHKAAPDVIGFKVYFQHGWLNQIIGSVQNVVETNNGFRINTNLNVDSNRLSGEWLKQAKRKYEITGNTAGPNSRISVNKIPEIVDLPDDQRMPRIDKDIAVVLTKPVQDDGLAVDYKLHSNWELNLTHQIKTVPGQMEYEIFIPNPPFPDPPFIQNGVEPNKTRYGQIGVNSYNEDEEGAVSAPSTVMAIHRKPPAKQFFEDAAALKASAPDFYGKSWFALRWQKANDPGVKYDIFRTMDQTLFLIDTQNRNSSRRTNAYYDNFINGFNSVNLNPEDITMLKSENPDYSLFNNNMLKLLASLPDNVDAFTKLNDTPVLQSDLRYADRDVSPPQGSNDPQPGNPDFMLFLDETLDGLGQSRYFYRIRPTDEIGNVGPLSEATLPIEIQKLTHPEPPVITEISAGDLSITIKWKARSPDNLLGFNIYRTTSPDLSDDCRRMKYIAIDGQDFTVVPNGQNQIEYAFTDNNIPPDQNHFYVIIAANSGENNVTLYSRESKVITARSIDSRIPEPPKWLDAAWVVLDISSGDIVEAPMPADGNITDVQFPAIKLGWESDVINPEFTILRQERDTSNWAALELSSAIEVTDGNKYRYYDDNASPDKVYNYKLIVKSQTGVVNIRYSIVQVGRP
ncbi:MAG: hypothetical protein AB1746_02435, partial [Candidatus Zixiibacteriota bacterium]